MDPIGVVRYPKGYSAQPRRYPASIQRLAWLMLVVFSLVVVITTGVSLGSYCLTSDGADVARLQPWLSPGPVSE